MYKKLLLFMFFISNVFFTFIANAATRQVWNTEIKNALLQITENDVIATESSGLWMLDTILFWVKDSLTWLLMIIAIWAFLFVWVRLALARWKPEEFKKAVTQMVYAIIWIFVVWFAWAAVTLVAGLNF